MPSSPEKCKAYRERPENKERERVRLAKAYAENREALSTKRRARYAANPEKALAKNREWRQAHLEQHRAQCRQWAKDNPEAMRAIVAKRRAQRLAAEGSYTAQDIERLKIEQGGQCNCCRVSLTTFHVDHIIPLSRGGSNWPSNLQLLCVTCNLSKADKLPHEFEAYRAAL